MRADRLLKLADFLETVPRKAFDISSWQARPASRPEGDVPGECGFAGCAIGWAVHIGIAPELRFAEIKVHETTWYELRYLEDDEITSFCAAAKAMDLRRPQAEYLFDPEAYNDSDPDDDDNEAVDVTPKMVADRIRKFVKDNA